MNDGGCDADASTDDGGSPCGSGSGGNTDIEGTCGDLTGSCTAAVSGNGNPNCQEWYGFASQAALFESECEGDGNTWSDGPCGSSYNFGCLVACQVSRVNYSDGSQLSAAMTACTAAGELVD